MTDDEPGSPASDGESPAANVVAGVVTLLTFVAAFGLLAAGWSYFWIAFPIGFGGVLPLAVALVKYRSKESGTETTEEEDALERLRERYARGEIDEREFERRVERLLETESVEGAESAYTGGPDGRDRDPSGVSESHARNGDQRREREREWEREHERT